MAPVEWDTILATDPTSLNEEDADSFFDMLKDVGFFKFFYFLFMRMLNRDIHLNS